MRLDMPITEVEVNESNLKTLEQLKAEVREWIAKNKAEFDELVQYFVQNGIIGESRDDPSARDGLVGSRAAARALDDGAAAQGGGRCVVA